MEMAQGAGRVQEMKCIFGDGSPEGDSGCGGSDCF